MQEIDNVLRIFRETRKAINDDDTSRIKQLSDQTIHSATIHQDADNVVVAVLVYSIAKILEREGYRNLDGWDEFYSMLEKSLDNIILGLEKGDVKKFRLWAGKLRDSLNKMDTHLAGYISDVFNKAEINKAFKLYEHGLSAEQTAELLGVSLWELSSYIGGSSIGEAHVSESMPIKDRIKMAEDFFE